MDLHLARLYLAGVLIMVVGITRLVVQSGMHYLTAPMASQVLAVALCGTAIAPPNVVALALAYSWCGDIDCIFLPSAAHAAKLNELFPGKRSLAIAHRELLQMLWMGGKRTLHGQAAFLSSPSTRTAPAMTWSRSQ